MVVQFAVHRGGPDRHVRMRIVKVGDALGTRHQAHEADRTRIDFLQPLDRGDRRVAGRKHRIEDDRIALAHPVRHLQVILDRNQRLWIAVQTDVPDPRARDDRQEAVEQSGAGAQDRHEHQLLAVDHFRAHLFERRLDDHLVHRNRPRDFIRHQRADLAQQPAETRRAGFLLAQKRELVLDEWMVEYVDFGGHGNSPKKQCRHY